MRVTTSNELWVSTSGGIIVPAGHIAESSDRQKTNVILTKARAVEIEKLFEDAGLSLAPTCGLAKLIEDAKILSDRWLMNEMADATRIDVFHALHLQRIADAVLTLNDVPERGYYLRKLMSGELNFFKRTESTAKNILWELELWSLLRRNGAAANLKDPPDIVLDMKGRMLGIACKKIYSENNVEKVLSEAVAQVEDQYEAGLVALNIEELTMEDTVLKANTEREMAQVLQAQCNIFLKKHERHFRKYLSNGRIIAALVSVHVIADVQEWQVNFNNCRQSTIWTIPGLSLQKQIVLREFERLMV